MAEVLKSAPVENVHVEFRTFTVMLNVGRGGQGSRFKHLSQVQARYLAHSLLAAADYVDMCEVQRGKRSIA